MKRCICGKCGKEYFIFPSQKGDKYCSLNCFNSVRCMDEKKCEKCGKLFYPIQRSKAGRFCSLSCYWESMKLSEEILKLHSKQNIRKYRREHPEWCAEVKQRRRALEVGAEGHFTAKDWKEIKERQCGKCADCGEKKKLTVDHIKPLSKGGSNYKENIQGLCGNCNSKKGVKI